MRAGPLIAVVLLLAACAGAPSPSPGQSPAATPAEPVRVLATDLWTGFESPFSVAAATDQAAYAALWAGFEPRPTDIQPAVDFGNELVLFLGMSGSSSCPEVFERLVVDGTGRVYADWAEQLPAQPCTDDLAGQGVLLAVSRAALPSEPFLFSLRAQPICPDCPDQTDRVVVDPR
jgi:hypothetical protein